MRIGRLWGKGLRPSSRNSSRPLSPAEPAEFVEGRFGHERCLREKYDENSSFPAGLPASTCEASTPECTRTSVVEPT